MIQTALCCFVFVFRPSSDCTPCPWGQPEKSSAALRIRTSSPRPISSGDQKGGPLDREVVTRGLHTETQRAGTSHFVPTARCFEGTLPDSHGCWESNNTDSPVQFRTE
ncbi:hypothetical protein F5882DRAFT_409037 [Hyaloscypha sp. PMI_1271]|nr:hypothetical protein F5882DRAFT_409037 [Hyaloscypha sp. PMI_1271]